MRSSWMKGGLMAIIVAIMACSGATSARAQFTPYANQNQAYPSYQAYQNQAYPNQGYQAQPVQGQGFQGQQPYQSQPMAYQNQPKPYQIPQPAPQSTAPQYQTAMAYQPSSLPQPAEGVAPTNMPADPAANYSSPSTAYTPAPVESFQGAGGYGSGVGSCSTGNCGTGYGCDTGYNTFSQGGCFASSGYGGCGCDTGCCCPPRRRWFGGVYGLYMERDGNPWKTLAFSTADANVPPYYPADGEFVLNLNDIDHDTFAGAEVRFGATFAACGAGCGGGCDSCCGGGCGSGCCGCHTLGWEVGYWTLFEEDTVASYADIAGERLYTMIDFRGLEYSPTGLVADYMPVNVPYDYGPPTNDYVADGFNDIEVTSVSARNKFALQNFEVNLLRLPILGNSCCTSSCGVGCGGCCDDCCGGGSCGNGCCGKRCGLGCCGKSKFGPYCGPRCSITSFAGFRYMRIDEDFFFRTDFFNNTLAAANYLSYNIDVDNQLAGFQLGFYGIYRFGRCGRWGLHCSSNAGIYNNHVDVWQRMASTGNVRYANGGNEDFNLRYEDDDVALVGELRVGGSYQWTCNCRFFGGYRMLGMSGVALAFDQIPTSFVTPAHTSYVDSDGSVFIHGLQGGVEYAY